MDLRVIFFKAGIFSFCGRTIAFGAILTIGLIEAFTGFI